MTAKDSRSQAQTSRQQEILAAAGDLIAAQGFLPIPMEQVARAAGVSKALVYVYFSSPAQLCNAVLEQRLEELLACLPTPRASTFEKSAAALAETYFDDVADHGATLHVLLTDAFLDGARSPQAIAARNALWRTILRASRKYLRTLSLSDRVAALAMLAAIPEDLGQLVIRGEMTRERARELCGRLIVSSLCGLRGAGGAAQ